MVTTTTRLDTLRDRNDQESGQRSVLIPRRDVFIAKRATQPRLYKFCKNQRCPKVTVTSCNAAQSESRGRTARIWRRQAHYSYGRFVGLAKRRRDHLVSLKPTAEVTPHGLKLPMHIKVPNIATVALSAVRKRVFASIRSGASILFSESGVPIQRTHTESSQTALPTTARSATYAGSFCHSVTFAIRAARTLAVLSLSIGGLVTADATVSSRSKTGPALTMPTPECSHTRRSPEVPAEILCKEFARVVVRKKAIRDHPHCPFLALRSNAEPEWMRTFSHTLSAFGSGHISNFKPFRSFSCRGSGSFCDNPVTQRAASMIKKAGIFPNIFVDFIV
jgi:hypothetical protein